MSANGRPIRALIVDDERLARASLRVLLAGDPEVELVGECGSAVDAVEAIRQKAPELLFLDVEMPRMNGLDLVAALGPARPAAVVFVTAHDRYAIDAFDVPALDYLLKPFDDRRFARALERAKSHIRQARLAEGTSDSPSTPEAFGQERIAVKEGERVLYLPLSAIDWIGADDYYVQLHVGDKAHLLREPMRDLEARLDARRFVRIHRSAIVAIDRVAEVGAAEVRLRDGTVLKLSRAQRPRLRALLSTVSGR